MGAGRSLYQSWHLRLICLLRKQRLSLTLCYWHVGDDPASDSHLVTTHFIPVMRVFRMMTSVMDVTSSHHLDALSVIHNSSVWRKTTMNLTLVDSALAINKLSGG